MNIYTRSLIIPILLCWYAKALPAKTFCHSDKCQSVTVSAPGKGDIYINGQFTGLTTPNNILLPLTEVNVSVGISDARQYYKKQINVTKKLKRIELNEQDLQAANIWKALFVGVPSVYGDTSDGQCTSEFSQADLDNAFEFFQFNLQDHIEQFSFGTVKWQIDRQDLTQPVKLHYNPNNQWYTLEAEQGLAQLSNIQPGQYDNIFLFWREQQDDCSFNSSYFGLAWLDPLADDTKKTGYVTVKFNPQDIGVAARLEQYKQQDPGVWTHEWLHVVIEQFYPDLGVDTPIPPKNALILHAAGAYDYQYPWINWYQDLIRAQVPLGNKYVGIGPEILLNCSIRQAALKQCDSSHFTDK